METSKTINRTGFTYVSTTESFCEKHSRNRDNHGARPSMPHQGPRPPQAVHDEYFPGIWIFYDLGMGQDNCHADYGCEGRTE